MNQSTAFWNYCDTVYAQNPHNMGKIASQVIDHLLSDAKTSLEDYGVASVLQDGLRKKIKTRYAQRAEADAMGQYDFSDISPDLMPVVKALSRSRYFVEGMDGHYSIAFLVNHPDHLQDAVNHLTRKGRETIAEAKRLAMVLVEVRANESILEAAE